jgi:hypothetical protein
MVIHGGGRRWLSYGDGLLFPFGPLFRRTLGRHVIPEGLNGLTIDLRLNSLQHLQFRETGSGPLQNGKGESLKVGSAPRGVHTGR